MMQNNFMPSKAVVIIVVSFLLAILIYSSVSQFDAFARPKPIDMLCRDATPTINGAVTAEVCCQIINGNITVCNKCQYDANGNTVGSCINFYPSRLAANSTSLPTPAGNALPPPGNNTGTPGKTTIFNPIRNITNALPGNNNTVTLPPGSIIKVPTGTLGSATNPPPTNNNTGNPIAMTSSDNPPGCSKKVPIPPNCTLNPFNNSASNKGIASLGNVIQTPVNHTNASPIGNNTSTPSPALKLSQPSLAGQQQTTGHHHHKGSSTGASTSTGSNSTSH